MSFAPNARVPWQSEGPAAVVHRTGLAACTAGASSAAAAPRGLCAGARPGAPPGANASAAQKHAWPLSNLAHHAVHCSHATPQTIKRGLAVGDKGMKAYASKVGRK